MLEHILLLYLPRESFFEHFGTLMNAENGSDLVMLICVQMIDILTFRI